jgi:hypothetical protein
MKQIKNIKAIEVGSIVSYLPKEPASWVGVVVEIKNNEETKRHGHSAEVYLVKDLISTAMIATKNENLLYLGASN